MEVKKGVYGSRCPKFHIGDLIDIRGFGIVV